MRVLLLFVICSLCACSSAKKARRAPVRSVLSPLHTYLVTAQGAKAFPGSHEIIITHARLRGEVLRFPYARQVDLVWAPDESAIAIVDSMAPSENRILIFALPSGRQLTEIRRDDTCVLDNQIPCGRDYAHVFYSNVVWLSPDQIQVNVEMYSPAYSNLPPEVHAVLFAPFSLNPQAPK